LDKRFRNILIPGLLVLLSLIVSLSYVSYTNSRIGNFTFPLDDAWIHLTFARNLARHHSLSYHPDLPSTSGSTAPFYTMILAIGFLFVENEFLLGGGASLLFFLGSVVLFHTVCRKLFPRGIWLPFCLSLLFATEWRLLWSSISGMETTLFIFFLLFSLYFLTLSGKRGWYLSGLFLGIGIWIRPEVLILAFPVAFYLLIERKHSRGDIGGFALCFLIPAFGYLLFNLFLSGTPLPNTFYAKGAFYRGFSRMEYLGDAIRFFLQAPLVPLLPFYLLCLIDAGKSLLKGKVEIQTLVAIFPLLLIGAYLWRIPLLFERGRYIQPCLPFFLLGAGFSIERFWNTLKAGKREKIAALVAGILIMAVSLGSAVSHRLHYCSDARLILFRHVKTAAWVRDHVPKGETIAAHDIGALGYYSGHPLLDLAGLIDPGAIRLMDAPEKQARLLREKGVHYLVIALDWKQFHPLLKSLPRRHLFPPRDKYAPPFRPMEVFYIDPGKPQPDPKSPEKNT